MCLCGVVLWGIFLQKQCWNFFILFVKERETWMVRNSPLLGRYLWHWALPRVSVNYRFEWRKAPLCLSSFCPHCLYHNLFYTLSMTNWRRVHGRHQGKNFFTRQLQYCSSSMQTSIWPQTTAYLIFINNIIVIFFSTGYRQYK